MPLKTTLCWLNYTSLVQDLLCKNSVAWCKLPLVSTVPYSFDRYAHDVIIYHIRHTPILYFDTRNRFLGRFADFFLDPKTNR